MNEMKSYRSCMMKFCETVHYVSWIRTDEYFPWHSKEEKGVEGERLETKGDNSVLWWKLVLVFFAYHCQVTLQHAFCLVRYTIAILKPSWILSHKHMCMFIKKQTLMSRFEFLSNYVLGLDPFFRAHSL